MSDLAVRSERPSDRDAVRRVNEVAFERPDEADLVDRLRQSGASYLGLVAEHGAEVVGHILFTPVAVDAEIDVRGLAPMAVRPEHQRSGVGAALVRAGLEACRAAGAEAIVVLGHPAYYSRFGFRPASVFGLAYEVDVPDEAFMALELANGALDTASGRVRYSSAFGA